VAFLNFSIKTDPNEPSVNAILESTAYLIKSNPNREEKLNKDAMKSLVQILTIPLKHFSLTVLKMSHFPTLMQYMAHDSKRTVSLKIVNAVIRSRKQLDSEPVLDQLVRFIEPLLNSDVEGGQAYEFEEEQEAVAKLLQLIEGDTLQAQYQMLLKFKKIFSEGGEKRQKYTVPPLVFQFFKFIYKLDHAVSQQDPEYEFGEGEEAVEMPDVDL
jgi:vacuolar protein sorting-associated protein 35